MRLVWYREHKNRLITLRCDDREAGRSALIIGLGKQWEWDAIATFKQGEIMEIQSGETVSMESAKEDVMRWFKEQEALYGD